ncbi:MAG TPA: DUF3179 domain-containing protein, partial [Dehalococcoidia bacterium]|nr:DUF3179 domain-containing protein [Dehalococcoidia bacterium]
ESHPRELIYWDSFFGEIGNPGGRREALLEAIGAAARDDPAYRAFLIDLALYPTPYRDRAWELLDTGVPFSGDAVLELFGDLGPASPADDLDAYVEFKSTLLSTIDPGFAALLNPREDHTISAQEVIWGGVPIDGIPALNDPAFVSASEAADWILPTDLVIGVEINGDARAYPRRIIDWHEMVNDNVGGVPVSLAYCTLCGSAILYDGRAGGEVLRFGTSGLLYRSNKLMYDTVTRTLWEQYNGEPAWGNMVGSGVRLEVLPAVHVTWADWLAAHPATRVLDIETGFRRDYGPGVAYADYWASPDLRFPAPDDQGPLAVKDIVYTVRLEGEAVAYPIELLAQRGLIEDEIGGRSVVIVATEDGNGGRAYERGEVSFTSVDFENGTLSSAGGARWRISEDVLVGSDGTVLQRLPGHNSFWFAVVNHAPQWRLYEE